MKQKNLEQKELARYKNYSFNSILNGSSKSNPSSCSNNTLRGSNELHLSS